MSVTSDQSHYWSDAAFGDSLTTMKWYVNFYHTVTYKPRTFAFLIWAAEKSREKEYTAYISKGTTTLCNVVVKVHFVCTSELTAFYYYCSLIWLDCVTQVIIKVISGKNGVFGYSIQCTYSILTANVWCLIMTGWTWLWFMKRRALVTWLRFLWRNSPAQTRLLTYASCLRAKPLKSHNSPLHYKTSHLMKGKKTWLLKKHLHAINTGKWLQRAATSWLKAEKTSYRWLTDRKAPIWGKRHDGYSY